MTAAAVVVLMAGCSTTAGRTARPAAAARPDGNGPTGPTTPIARSAGPAPSTTRPRTVPATAATPITRPRSQPTAPAVATTVRRAAAAPTCPSNLASQLAGTGGAGQLVTVVSAGWGTYDATVQLWQRSGGCWASAGGPWPSLIGQNGFSDHHIEGDSTTPTGRYGLGPVMYGNQPDPGVREPYRQLVCGDWWDEDPTSPGYNTFQHVRCGEDPPFRGGSEALWKETTPYPSFAVIDYNTGPIVKGAGSAIFLHAYTGVPTSGCVSIPQDALDQALRWLNPTESPQFVMGPASEIAGF